MRIYLISFCIFSTICGNAQQSGGAIDYLPFQASDYLILNIHQHPEVTDWDIEIFTAFPDSTGMLEFTTVYQMLLSGTYFTKIDPQYNDGDHFIQVTGLDINRDIIVYEGPVPICPGCETEGESCKIWCAGSTYAWTANYWNPEGAGSSTISLGWGAYKASGQPFYQYFSQTQFNALSPSDVGLMNYYNVTAWNSVTQGTKIIKLTGVESSDGLMDATSNLLSGTVYGIRKWWGPWYGNDPVMAENVLATLAEVCIETEGVPVVVNIINTNTFSNHISPDLECSGFGTTGTPTLPEADESEAELFEADCWKEMLAFINAAPGTPEIIAAFEALMECMTEEPGISWPNNVEVINVAQFVNPSNEVTTITEADIFLPNGEFTSFPLTLDSGLYVVGIQFSDKSYFSFFYDSPQAASYTFPLSAFLSASVFPVPIEDDEFTLSLQADAKLKFDYVLSDFSGEELYRKTFVVQKGHNRLHPVKVNQGIPDGQLVNRFIFEDGSELQFQTVK